ASDKAIAERPEVVDGFVDAVLKAIGDITADPAQAARDYVSFMPQHTGKEADVEAILRSYAELVYPEGENQPLGAFDPERIKQVQSFYVEHGIVQEAVPVEDLYTNEFVQ